MIHRDTIITAYIDFWDSVKDYVDNDGWIAKSDYSVFIRNCFWLDGNIEEKDGFWRPKTLSNEKQTK